MTDLRDICILGEGLVGAMSAAYLGKMLPSSEYRITYFEHTTHEDLEALFVTLHSDIRRLNTLLKIPEAEFVSRCDSVFSLGENFVEDKGVDYIQTYCPYGLSLEGIDFISVMQRLGKVDNLKNWEAFNLPATMIRKAKFTPPDSKGRPVVSDFTYGYQVNPKHYSDLLLEKAVNSGVRLASAIDIKSCVKTENQPAFIETKNGEKLYPHLIIDGCYNACFKEVWDNWTPSHVPNFGFEISRDETQFNNHVTHKVSKTAIQTFFSLQSENITLKLSTSNKGTDLKLGKPFDVWVDNLVRLGHSYGALPVLGAPLRLNQIALEQLIHLFPSGKMQNTERREYNHVMKNIYNRFDDFQSLWLKGTKLCLSADITLSDEAAYKRRLFENRGRIAFLDNDKLFQDNWTPLFLGQNIWPKRQNPLVGGLAANTLEKFENDFRNLVTHASSNMPTTTDFIQKHCPSTAAQTLSNSEAETRIETETKTMSQKSSIKSILIAGGGTAGWMTAAALARTLGSQNVKITLIESEVIGTVGVGEATIPNIAQFNSILGIDESVFMKATQATIKYGIEFVGWSKEGDSYFHPFGQHGHDMAGISFHQLWRKLYGSGDVGRIENYCATAMAAKHGKAGLPPHDPKKIMSTLSHAYQFDAGRYARFLRQYAEEKGVTRIEGKITDIDLFTESGHIESVTLENGQTLQADFFIDCTGFRALLLNKVLGVGYRDWSHWLPCNSAQAVGCEKTTDAVPYTRATAREAGWQWRIPLQHRIGNGYVYASDFISDARVTDTLLSNLDGKAFGSPKQLRFTTGRREELWSKNCVAIGLSGGFLEPLESTSIYLIQAGISRLLALFPDNNFDPVERAEYNKLMSLEFEQIRDFLILHYVANERHGEPFWDYVRNMDIPDGLTRKIELFKNKGRFFRYDGDLFTETSWVAVFLGQNILPKGYNPLVDGLPEKDLATALNAMKSEIARNIPTMPSHEDFLARYCPAPAEIS